MQIEWDLEKRTKAAIKLLLAGKSPLVKLPRIEKTLFIGTPIHDNLGDHLLAYAGGVLLANVLPARRVLELSTEEYMLNKSRVADSLSPDDFVFIAGGGWMGDSWPSDEMIIRDIVELVAPICPVIVLPQTIHFKQRGKLFGSGQQFWSNAANTYVCVRDEASHHIATEALGFPRDRCLLLPDLGLLYETKERTPAKRSGALVCLRQDRESLTSDQERSWLDSVVREHFGRVVTTSTLTRKVVPPVKRRLLIDAKISEFAAARFVLTDRLHGMIFAALAGTPCIAINNATGKVRGVSSAWLSDYSGIRVIEKASDIVPLLEAFDSVFPESSQLEKEMALQRNVLFSLCKSKLKEIIYE